LQFLETMLAPPATDLTAAPATPLVNASARGEVTVIIAAWRAAGTIGRAVSSALAQCEAAEVVVVDDASGDNGATLEAAKAADDGSGRLKVVALDTNGGPARARNAAIAASKAPWIAVLDSDDFMEPGRLAALLALAHEGYDLIADDLMQTPDGQPVSAGQPLWFRGDRTPLDVSFTFFVETNVPKAGRHRRELGFLKPLMRRSFLERNGISYDETMRLGEDYDLYARALSFGARMHLIPWTGYVSVMRANSLSAIHSSSDLAALETADDRLLASNKLRPSEKWLVKQHRFSTQSRIVWIDFMSALKARKPGRVMAVLLKDPRQIPYVLAGLWKIVVRRATGAPKAH
jgi:succinoglycan biosynthesis protein ExoU